ncbi:MAG TPA: DUF2868 domain-containing protein, partial [Ramlibacter sp.]|nr:DUF2868 domain-containing protein [Ramlibacter sp.]
MLTLDAATARRLLLVQAIETADTQGKLLGAIERDQIEREAVDACKAEAERDAAAGREPNAIRYLDERARRMLAAVDNRDPRTAALQHAEPWQHVLAWGLPAIALAAGALLERIDNPHQVNMLSPPLLAFLAWNLVVYLLLLTRPLWPSANFAQGPLGALRRWLAQPGSPRRGPVRLQVAAQLRLRWWRVAGALESLRLQQLFHASAAAWAVGVALSIVLGGLVREYRVGWESTLLDLPQVHALLRTLFAPVVALLPLEGFSLADLERMHFRSGVDVGRAEARHWIALYLGLLGLVVVVPRLLLALYARVRRGWLGRNVQLDLGDPYFTDLLARVSPAFVTLAWGAADGPARRTLQRAWREAGGSEHDRFTELMDTPAAATHFGGGVVSDAATLLRTDRGDELELVELNLRALAARHPSDAQAEPSGDADDPGSVTPLSGARRWLSLMRGKSPGAWFGPGEGGAGGAKAGVK